MSIVQKGLIRVLNMSTNSISGSRTLWAYINRAKPIEFKAFLYKQFLNGSRPDHALEFIIEKSYHND
jgi:hypothetical protein